MLTKIGLIFNLIEVVTILLLLIKPVSLKDEPEINFCEEKYKCGYQKHIFCILEHKCSQGPNCKDFKAAPLTKIEKRVILDKHNELRNFIALGEEKRSLDGKPWPSAADMRELVWDEELEFGAQCWANQCPVDRNRCRDKADGSPVAQSLAWSTKTDLIEVLEGIYNETENATTAIVDEYRKSMYMVDRFTQFIHANTSQLGCARSTYYYERFKTKTYLIVCHYAWRGNWEGVPIYKRGKPCSACPKGTKCHKKYKGLCTTKPSTSKAPNICKFSNEKNCQSNLRARATKITKKPDRPEVNFCEPKYNCGYQKHALCVLEHKCNKGLDCKYFKTMPFTQAEKMAILDKHNELRNFIAMGNETRSLDGKPWPSAADMRELVWDEELEFGAQCWANQCPVGPNKCPSKIDDSPVGQNLAWSTENVLKDMLEGFYNETENTTIAIVDKYEKSVYMIDRFTQFIHANSSQLGCGRSTYYYEGFKKQAYFIVCHYAWKGNWEGEPIYQKGKPCSACPQGTKCHQKYKGLCATEPSTSQEPNICKFSKDKECQYTILGLPNEVDFCDAMYDCGSEKHTLCTLGHKCSQGPNCKNFQAMLFAEDEKKLILDKHNELRSYFALGNEKRSLDGKPWPSVANMRELVWDEELEFHAQCWANQCPMGHSPCRKKSDGLWVGENLGWATNDNRITAIEKFYNEVENASTAIVDKYQKPSYIIGHFTQLINANTSQVGCGRSKFDYMGLGKQIYVLVCQYAWAGNWQGEPIYKKGKPCSACPQGSTCHKTYKGLCTTEPSTLKSPNICKFSTDKDCQPILVRAAKVKPGQSTAKKRVRANKLKPGDKPKPTQTTKPTQKTKPAQTKKPTQKKPKPGSAKDGPEINFCTSKYDCGGEKHNICTLGHKCDQGPDCTSFEEVPLTEDDKKLILDKHNELRNKFALGNDKRSLDGKPWPTVANMQELVWDEELEFHAQCWANQCPKGHGPCRKKTDGTMVGENLGWSTSDNRISAIEEFYKEIENASTTVVDVYQKSGYKIGHFTQLIYAATSQLGCARTKFFYEGFGAVIYFLACQYATAGNVIGQPLYKKGKPCSACPKGSKCHTTYKGLCTTKPSTSKPPNLCKSTGSDCQPILDKGKKGNASNGKPGQSEATKKKPSEETETNKEGKIRSALLNDGPKINFCDSKYSCNEAKNTLCQLGHKCGQGPNCKDFEAMPFTEEDKKVILDKHNELRNFFALGNENRSLEKKPWPSVANMRELVWDQELEFHAQCWANQCPDGHSPCRRKSDGLWAGENLGWSTSDNRITAIQRFYDEAENASIAIVDKFESSTYQIGHFTQVIFANSSQLGCARTKFLYASFGEKAFFLACQYAWAGNWRGEPLYKKGKPCSACPTGSTCHKTYKGLCTTKPSTSKAPNICNSSTDKDCQPVLGGQAGQGAAKKKPGKGEKPTETGFTTELFTKGGKGEITANKGPRDHATEECIIHRKIVIISGSTGLKENPGRKLLNVIFTMYLVILCSFNELL